MPKTIIACFSATGNSLYISRRLEADKIITIGKDSSIDDDAEILGIVTPVYCGTLPIPVKEFISSVIAKRDNSNLKYIFGILTYGKAPFWAASHLSRALQDAGCVLSYVNRVQMPDAYLPIKRKAVISEKCLCCYACYHICPVCAIGFPGAEGQYEMPENMKGRYR